MPLTAALPRSPVIQAGTWWGRRRLDSPAVDDLPNLRWHSSGRAALKHAVLMLMAAGTGRRSVLVPSYHCPTMAAAVVAAGAQPLFYAIGRDGAPLLDPLAGTPARDSLALIVPHYFGTARSLAAERRWCDAHGVALIEDCAHTFFGQAGERPIGAWGDFAIASLTKFFPIDEAGLLASATRALPMDPLGAGPSIGRTAARLLLASARAGHLPLIGSLLRAIESRGSGAAETPTPPAGDATPVSLDTAAALAGCDMGRSDHQPGTLARRVCQTVSRARLGAQRRHNWEQLAAGLSGLPGCRPLRPGVAGPAPYVYPLWIDEPEGFYRRLRAAGAPVFRWDTRWPGVRDLPDDHGGPWSRNVVQFLCHQSLGPGDIARIVAAARQAAGPEPHASMPSNDPTPLPRIP